MSGPFKLALFALLMSAFAASPANAAATATVKVVTEPPLGVGLYTFSGTPAGEINLTLGETLGAKGLSAGTYQTTLTLLDPAAAAAGYAVAEVVCDDKDSTGDAATKTATFVLKKKEAVTCTFVLRTGAPRSGSSSGQSTQGGQGGQSGQQGQPGQPGSPNLPGTPSQPGPVTTASCTCPKAGVWSVTNHTGAMVCTGVVNISRPLKADTSTGTLTVSNNCQTIVAESSKRGEADIEMHRAADCRYHGVVNGQTDGIPMEIAFEWVVKNASEIDGTLHSTVSQQGMTCNMDRAFDLTFKK